MVNLLRILSEAHGPSGFEEPVRKIMVEKMKPLASRISYDGLGSVIAVQEGTAGSTGRRSWSMPTWMSSAGWSAGSRRTAS